MSRKKYFVSPLIMLITLIVALIVQAVPTSQVHAEAISATGLSAKDAKVTLNGKEVTGDTDRYQSYTVSYKWSIADDVDVKDGDTITFELPSNVQIVGQTNITATIKNNAGAVVGTAVIKPEATTGTITITNAQNLKKYSRTGTLEFAANGKTIYSSHNWTINKVGGTTESNGEGYVTWEVAYNPDAKKLSNVVLTDTIGEGQDYVDGSLTVKTGSFDSNNNFTADGSTINAKISQNGQVLTIDVGDISTGIYITYQTKPNAKAGNKLTNSITDGSNNTVNAEVSWSGSGTANGVDGNKPETPNEKTDSTNNPAKSENSTNTNNSKTNTNKSTKTNSTINPKSSTLNSTKNNNSYRTTTSPHGITTTTIRSTTQPQSEDDALKTSTYNANANKTLPQTGDSDGNLLIQVGSLMAVIGAILGSIVIRKKD